MTTRYQSRRLFKARMATYFVYIVLVALSTILAYQVMRKDIERQVKHNISNIIQHIDSVLEHVDEAARYIGHYSNVPCSGVQRMMTIRTLSIPSGLSMEVKWKDGYCNTIDGFSTFPIHPQNTASLFVDKGFISTKALYYRIGDTTAELNIYYVLDQLQIQPDYVHFHLVADGLELPASDLGQEGIVDGISVRSSSYSYAIHTDYQWTLMISTIATELLLTLLFSILVPALICYQFYKFISQPKYLARELRHAIKLGQLKAYVQPVVTHDGKLKGGEVLVRWHHPKKGVIGPYEFIDLLEKAQLASGLCHSLFSQVSEQLKGCLEHIANPLHLSFNLCGQQLLNRRIVDDALSFYREVHNPNIKLILELTEREQIFEDERVRDIYNDLYRAGVRFSIDDFGTGHSSLIYLQMFKISYIKIDKQFIDLIGKDTTSNNIVNNLLDLSRRLEIPTIAEGIENQQQKEYLEKNGVDYYQGYLFSKPIVLNEFIQQWLLNSDKKFVSEP
ncbi:MULTISPECIES: EAL domain-containing protein [Vibrio]|uniref:EAL domain-containing protein n=2 Tax=Vibrio TaxID=662 RepID=A0A7X4LN98_9VIBR|nr:MULTISPECIES: cyclic diguanylate phosphodiesterase [Vibrio]MBF8999719.1 EAL domain-containing protein [Vibrio nitrifigilis]MZI94916.1 EAL domain-containing protein [Vibrio eleionomae]